VRELPARRGQGYCTATVRILLIEDDKQAARWLSKGLQEERFVVEVAYTGPGGSKLGRGEHSGQRREILTTRRAGMRQCLAR